jgi:hypothetical protein
MFLSDLSESMPLDTPRQTQRFCLYIEEIDNKRANRVSFGCSRGFSKAKTTPTLAAGKVIVVRIQSLVVSVDLHRDN